ncbi:MAG: hypothetical protein Q8P46_16785 [Hyphomicrobiales bacterium]|nr:hypothetical protein [Hyphomicrobiales bacterium]
MRKYKFQLQDRPIGAFAGPSIIGSGGQCLITSAGDCAKLALTDADGAALTNPISLTRGSGEFYTANTVDAVDLFILTGEGFATQLWSVGPDELHEVPIDRSNRSQMLVFPFSIDDQVSDNTEVDTGLDLIVGMVMQPFPYVKVVTADAGETVDVGTGEVVPADGGDADGFVSLLSLTSTGLVADTNGALLNAVEYIAPADSLTWTLSAASDTAEGYVFLPYRNLVSGTPIITQA